MKHLPERSLSREDLADDPFVQFRLWYDEAGVAAIPLADAIALATADRSGRPSVRHVLLRGFDERGFAFYTNYESRKGHELAENPHAALTMLWKEHDRQVSATGAVRRTSREESEAYFRTRPREAQIGAWASEQSRVLSSRAALEQRFERLSARFPDEVPLPPSWGGFRLVPDAVEFWQGRAHRLHDRFRYERQAETGPWRLDRLFP